MGTPNPLAPLHIRRSDGIAGSLTEERRDIKDSEEILERLSQLDVHELSYRDSNEYRHLGPMAEDFHEVFGLSMGSTSIAPRDLTGIALAASQALPQKNRKQERRMQTSHNG